MDNIISINHGSGGRMSHDLIRDLFVSGFGMTDPLTDSFIIDDPGHSLAFTTDSYVVDPVFFPGGDIGKLAVCGTVNDLAVSGASPRYISASFIIEEGFPLADLEKIVSSMAGEAKDAGVRIVTGDTKVVEKGKCDKIFITTTGIGILKDCFKDLSSGERILPGDRLIINGPLGNHAVAVLGARNQLHFSTPVISDCSCLNHLIGDLLGGCSGIRFMRDLTRGGLAAVLNELAEIITGSIEIDEDSIQVDEPVRGLCELLGFDPLFLANEGKVLIVVSPEEAGKALEVLHKNPSGKNACDIGTIKERGKAPVILNTSTGSRRVIDIPSGSQLPRIC